MGIYGAKLALSCVGADGEHYGKVLDGEIILDSNEIPGKGAITTLTLSLMAECDTAISVRLDNLIEALKDFTTKENEEV